MVPKSKAQIKLHWEFHAAQQDTCSRPHQLICCIHCIKVRIGNFSTWSQWSLCLSLAASQEVIQWKIDTIQFVLKHSSFLHYLLNRFASGWALIPQIQCEKHGEITFSCKFGNAPCTCTALRVGSKPMLPVCQRTFCGKQINHSAWININAIKRSDWLFYSRHFSHSNVRFGRPKVAECHCPSWCQPHQTLFCWFDISFSKLITLEFGSPAAP